LNRTVSKQRIRSILNEFIRYGIVGVLRTLLGFGLLYILSNVLGANYILSNIIVYSVGLALGFFLHKRWAFRSSRKWKIEIIPYLVSFALAYSANILTLILLAESFHIDHTISQGASMFVFIIISYLVNKLWTFRA
jgi:putative flippase GtrA